RGAEPFGNRIVRLFGVEWIFDWAFDRLVVLRKWPGGEQRQRGKNARYTLGIHNERPHVFRRFGVRFEVRHVVTDPFLRRLIPPDLSPRRVPGFPVRVARRAVVENPAVRGPRPSPTWIQA